jgi:VanZ family protein
VASTSRRLTIAGLILAYVCVGWWPFRWQPPQQLRNQLTITRTGTLRFEKPGLARTRHPATWLAKAIKQHELSIDLVVRAFLRDQPTGVILTISRDMSRCNLRIRQEHRDLIIRVRTPETAHNAQDLIRVRNFFAADEVWRKIHVSIRPRELTLQVDDQYRSSVQLSENPLANWNHDYQLVIGNEPTGNAPWLGEISTAILTVEGQPIDYLAPGWFEIPETYWSLYMAPRWIPFKEFDWQDGSVQDYLTNLLAFIPLGGALGCLLRGKRRMSKAIVSGVFLSACIEATQLFFAGRFPSSTDLLLNSIGNAAGALRVLLLKHYR